MITSSQNPKISVYSVGQIQVYLGKMGKNTNCKGKRRPSTAKSQRLLYPEYQARWKHTDLNLGQSQPQARLGEKEYTDQKKEKIPF